MIVIPSVNWQGLKTLYLKEVRRFFKVQLQTVWAPAITTLLFLVIFAVAMTRSRPVMMGVPFADFLGPGLIVMGMIQNSFRQHVLIVVDRQDPGHDRRRADAAAIDRRADGRLGRQRADPRLAGRYRGCGW